VDASGKARMVDVSAKPVSVRRAVAQAFVRMNREAFDQIVRRRARKGDVLAVASVAGIQAAKRAGELIPLCHSLNLTHVGIEFFPDRRERCIRIEATCEAADRTGVEMEALVAASTAALTIYDMAKAVDRSMVIGELFLLEKSGGRSGPYRRSASSAKGRRNS
jgi:cyclic pyranopterin phosphate synthase